MVDHLIRLEIHVREANIRKEHLIAIFFDLEKSLSMIDTLQPPKARRKNTPR